MQAGWCRIVVAVFTMAFFYASVCSTTCAVGVCPKQARQTSSHDCESSTSQHRNHSGSPAPQRPDCSKHPHPSPLFVKSGDSGKLQLNISRYVSAAVPLGPSRLIANLADSEASDLAPPPTTGVSLYQQISVLRI